MDTIVVDRKSWQGTEYGFIRNIKPNAADARSVCRGLGMDLVKIESSQENQFIMESAFEEEGIEFKDGKQYWIGANDQQDEGNWVWVVDGNWFYDEKNQKSINGAFESWGKTTLGGQPNNVLKNGEDEDCTVIREGGFWYDIGCTTRFAYVVCESTK